MNKSIVLLTAAFFAGQAAFAQFGDTRKVTIHKSLLKCYEGTNRLAETGAEYATLVQLAPSDGVLRYNYGFYLDKAGKSNLAVAQYQAAARLDPTNIQAHVNLAKIYMNQKNYQAALNEYSRCGSQYQAQIDQLQKYMQSVAQQRAAAQMAAPTKGGTKAAPKKSNNDDDDE